MQRPALRLRRGSAAVFSRGTAQFSAAGGAAVRLSRGADFYWENCGKMHAETAE
jgi:hypothetical protein